MFSNGIAAFTFDTVHTAIPLEIFVIKRIYELFYAIGFFVEQCLHKLFCQTCFFLARRQQVCHGGPLDYPGSGILSASRYGPDDPEIGSAAVGSLYPDRS